MPQEETASRTVCPTPTEPATRQETTLRKAIVERVMLSFELDGLVKAREEFEQMRRFFSGNRDWPDIEEVVMAFFKERKWVEAQAADERQLQIEKAMMEGLKRGLNPGQLNFLTGAAAQAPYHSTTSIIGGHKQ